MAVGYQKFKSRIFFVVCTLLLLQDTPCQAATVDELYAVYGMEYSVEYPKDVLDIIDNYNYAKRYMSMYRYVVESEYDVESVNKNIEYLEDRLTEIEGNLSKGFDLSLDEIYLLEDEYTEVHNQLERAKKSLISVDVDVRVPTSTETPTYDEYVNAMQEKALLNTQAELGNVKGLDYPIATAALVKDLSDTHLTLSVAEGSTATSLFNGKVVDITDDSITLYHYNNVYTLYKGVQHSYVVKGDTVYQGQSIGTVNSNLTLKLKLNGKLVDVSLLFKED